MELDIFIPELNKAVEFNGGYWHSREKTKIKDRIKKEECENKGIKLLVIDEQNWIYDRKRCLNIINNFVK